jgi:hypothetical protein
MPIPSYRSMASLPNGWASFASEIARSAAAGASSGCPAAVAAAAAAGPAAATPYFKTSFAATFDILLTIGLLTTVLILFV